MLIAGIDGGDTTGFVIMQAHSVIAPTSLNKKTYLPVVEKVFYSLELKFPDDMQGMRGLLSLMDVVVIEDFIIRRQAIATSPTALKVNGVVEQLCFQANVKCVIQQPAEKQRMPNKRLLEYGLKHKSPHIMDAYRHALIYLCKGHYPKPTE